VDTFVGRLNERERILSNFEKIEDGVVCDVVGVHGIGKTSLLERVRLEALELEDRPTVYDSDLGPQRGLDDTFRGDYGADASAAVLWLTFLRSRELMLSSAEYFADQMRSEDFEEFKQVCEQQAGLADAYVSDHDLRAEARRSDPTAIGDQLVRARIREFQKVVDDAFVEAWDQFTARRRVLLSLDSFENIASNELGQWLVNLALRLPRTLTILARTPTDVLFAPGHARLHQFMLAYFTLGEVNEFLQKRLPSEALQPGIAEAIYDYTDGHPGGTELAAKLILEKGGDLDARTLRRIFDRLPDDPEERWGKLVHLICDVIRDPTLRAAVDVAPVALTFDEPLLAALLGRDAEQGAGDAVEVLKAHRLAQPARGDVRENRVRLLEFIRRSLAEGIRINHPTRWRKLHGLAARYYFDLLEKDESEYVGAPYGQWYRYEKPEWQANKQDWIYHSGQVPERRELTRARFVLVFFEAFWWWACYEKFPFTQRLLEDWERGVAVWDDSVPGSTNEGDQQLATALWFILENYPLGYVKHTMAWKEIESRLKLIRRLCGIAPGSALPPNADERKQMARTRAMIAVFLAHSRRYRDPADIDADRYYGEALKIFDKLGDNWTVAWLTFETADQALERKQPRKAVFLLGKSAALLRDVTLADWHMQDKSGADRENFGVDDDIIGAWDYELLANLHRARADAHWLCAELESSAAEYGRAVTNAYWFQGQPRPPDAYTRRFYEEVTTRTAERILTLLKEDVDRAVKFAQSITAELPTASPLIDAISTTKVGEVADIAKALFPRGPDPATELLRPDTPFMDEWSLLWDDRSDPAEQLVSLITDDSSS
jgi:hypothetical protein